jgi:hypothetical protein
MTPDRWTARPRGASFRKRLARGRPEFDDVSAVRLRAEDHDAILGRQSSSQSRLHKRKPWTSQPRSTPLDTGKKLTATIVAPDRARALSW